MVKTKEEQEEENAWNFNEGRIHCDRKWLDTINDRIKELEKQVGIPELRRLKKEAKYTWKNDEDKTTQKKLKGSIKNEKRK